MCSWLLILACPLVIISTVTEQWPWLCARRSSAFAHCSTEQLKLMRSQERTPILLNAYEKWFSHSWFLFNFLADTYVPLLPFPLSQWDSFAWSTKQKLWLKQRAIAKQNKAKNRLLVPLILRLSPVISKQTCTILCLWSVFTVFKRGQNFLPPCQGQRLHSPVPHAGWQWLTWHYSEALGQSL